MSDIHVQRAGRNEIRLLYHIPVPEAQNEAGVSYRTAIVKSGAGGATALPDAGDGDNPEGWEIGAAEKAAILDGSLYEHGASVKITPAQYASQAALLAAVRADYAASKTIIRQRLQRGLRFWGAGINESQE